MKTILLFAFLAIAAADDNDDLDYYTTGNDYLDVDSLVSNISNLKAYVDCFLDKGPCDDLTSTYRHNIPEAIQQACKRCNSPQKHIFWGFLLGLKSILPESYEELKQKYDPENIYMERLEKEISKY